MKNNLYIDSPSGLVSGGSGNTEPFFSNQEELARGNYHVLVRARRYGRWHVLKALREELLIDVPMEQTVMSYAENAARSGLDGVVCSPLEAGRIHEVCGAGFLTVTPGVRFTDSQKDDQTRITTPAGAKAIGSDYIVVGRPITQAADPAAAYGRCVAEFAD